jgi:UDP-N-acetylmuramoyl-L-alanyl-D-glutamate--2,6-diaminopimelate ligase
MADSPVRPTTTQPVAVASLIRALPLSLHSGDEATTVSGVALSSDAVVPGDLFIALPGAKQHGAKYVPDVVAKGAAAILTDSEGAAMIDGVSVPVLVASTPREIAGRVSALVYANQATQPAVLAVTGTNGKTSVTFYLEAIFRALGVTTALSNSSERQIVDTRFYTKLTTPEAPELHAMLAVAAEAGVGMFALEASAQAIERHRLDGLVAQVAGFTNLSHDHFEDFGDMESYLERKLALFQPNMSTRAVVSLESEWGHTVVERSGVPVVTLGDGASGADWVIGELSSDGWGQRFSLRGPAGELHTSINAVGAHMVRNAALALVMAVESGVSIEQLQVVNRDHGGIDVTVPGRIERVSGSSPVAVFVDAGRSADAYQNTFENLRERTDGKLIVVCGTSGDRDRSKRPIMGEIAARLANLVIVTDDDPRTEDPAQIRADLLAGARSVEHARVEEIADPTQAIRRAVAEATPGDVVVWMGPGSQHYRDVGGERISFSARQQAQDALREAGW